jgi:acetylornithine aminotransferase
LAVIDQIRSGNHLQLNKVKGALIRNLISPIVGVKEVRGKGLLIGIVLQSNQAKMVSEKLQQLGFLTNPASDNVIRIAPAFIVSEAQIMKFVAAFNDVCEEVFHG